MDNSKDFIVSELISELKADGARKDAQITRLHKSFIWVCGLSFFVLLMVVAGFLLYLNQYDFTSTSTVEQTAEGLYALIDSAGNTVAWDITPEELNNVLEVITNG